MSTAQETLVVAPYAGEFGWELMNWQGRVRWVVAQGDYACVVLCARPDRRVLYAAQYGEARFIFCPIEQMELPGRANDDHRVDAGSRPIPPEMLKRIVAAQTRRACRRANIDVRQAAIVMPDYGSALWPTTRAHQRFAELRRRRPVTTDVVLVPRRRGLSPQRNQPDGWWQDLAGRLRRHGLTVETYARPLDRAIQQLSGARLAVGASTGGLHLASLCRCPHYVWGSGPEARWTRLGITNRQRYETIWNPFGTTCRYDECGWQPTVSHVVDQVRRALDEIGLARGDSPSGWAFKPKWRIKRRLAGLLTPDPAGGRVPWRLRELVRERMV